MPEEENGNGINDGNENGNDNGNGGSPPVDPLVEFTKNLLGFYDSGADVIIGPLVLSAQQYLINAGVLTPVEPPEPVDPEELTPEEAEAAAAYEKEFALYKIAIATRVKALHDGDIKGEMERILTGIILQIKDYAGGETL